MTLPDERTSAVIRTRAFLLSLASGETKRIPSAVREQARRLLRHYPGLYDLDRVAEVNPDIFSKVSDNST